MVYEWAPIAWNKISNDSIICNLKIPLLKNGRNMTQKMREERTQKVSSDDENLPFKDPCDKLNEIILQKLEVEKKYCSIIILGNNGF